MSSFCKRPTLADCGSLIIGNSGPTNSGPTLKGGAINVSSLRDSYSAPAAQFSEADSAPVAVLDEEIDAVVSPDESIFGGLSAAPVASDSKESVVHTLVDEIEAVCSKISPAVRAFIENEMRGKFVGVQRMAK